MPKRPRSTEEERDRWHGRQRRREEREAARRFSDEAREIAARGALSFPEPPAFVSAPLILKYFRYPSRIPASAWAEGNLVLEGSAVAKPGPVDLRQSPHAREILDCVTNPLVEHVTMLKCTQSAGSFTMHMMLCYTISEQPGPSMFILPTQDLANKTSSGRILPLLETTPALAQYMPTGKNDLSKLHYKLRNMDLYFAWAGSPSTIASFPIRYLYRDECDKFPAMSGKEADPMKLSYERTITFWNRFIVDASTPTDDDGFIWREYLKSDERRYFQQCPHCREWRPLIFHKNVQWETGATADDIKRDRCAWYVCEVCQERILERHRLRMIQQGIWVPRGARVTRAGQLVDVKEVAVQEDGDDAKRRQDARGEAGRQHRGYQWNRMVTPEGELHEMAAEFVSCHNDEKAVANVNPLKMMNFVNSWLGEVWVEQTEKLSLIIDIDGSDILGVPPDQTEVLIAGADVQGDHVWYVVRAFLEGGDESVLVEEGRFDQFDSEGGKIRGPFDDDPLWAGIGSDLQQLYQYVMQGTWETKGKRDLDVRGLAIDSRFRRAEVFGLMGVEPERVFAAEGANQKMTQVFDWVYLSRNYKGSRKNVFGGQRVLRADTGFFKDVIARQLRQNTFRIPDGTSGQYQKHLVSEQKKVVRDTLGRGTEVWVKRQGYDDNHLLDCEVYAMAYAYALGWKRNAAELQRKMRKKAARGTWFKKKR